MTAVTRLLFPAIRWDRGRGDWDGTDRIGPLARLGVGGWILFGGAAPAVAELTAELRAASPHPILVGADLERGAGQQFEGATPLPPAAALGSLHDPAATRQAAELTAREARALGVDWVYAPVADVDVEPANPIVGTRAFGADPAAAARQVAAWVEGCRTGALATAKHFPGHGRTTADSHLGLPVVDVDGATLDVELAPFRAAVEAGVDAIMTAHVAFPALDPSGAPATLSRPILHGLLRERMGFRGLVVTDALIMEGVTGNGADGPRGSGEAATAAVRAVTAGCDALLYPPDPEAVAAALEAARGGALPAARVAESAARIRAAAEARTAGASPDAGVGLPGDRSWALELAVRTVHAVRGEDGVANAFELVTVDDDVGGPYAPPARSTFPATLAKAGRGVIPVDVPGGGRPVVVAVYADIRGFKGRPGLGGDARSAVRRVVDAAPSSLVVLFGHPRLAAGLPGENVVCAWGGEPLMQEAAAVKLAGQDR
ncbi:MAG: glycoside hydrolase family 3 N-terminal domain-containing protein [Longimicrobiales bacterium]